MSRSRMFLIWKWALHKGVTICIGWLSKFIKWRKTINQTIAKTLPPIQIAVKILIGWIQDLIEVITQTPLLLTMRLHLFQKARVPLKQTTTWTIIKHKLDPLEFCLGTLFSRSQVFYHHAQTRGVYQAKKFSIKKVRYGEDNK